METALSCRRRKGFTKLDDEDALTIDYVIIEEGLGGGSPDEIRSKRKSYTIGKPL